MSDGIFPHRVTIEPIVGRTDDRIPVFAASITPRALVVPGRAVVKLQEGKEVVRSGVVYVEGVVEAQDGYITMSEPFSPAPSRRQIILTKAFSDERGRVDTTEVWFQ